MTTAKDYLESALKFIEEFRAVAEQRNATLTHMASGLVSHAEKEILAAARVLGIELDTDKQAK